MKNLNYFIAGSMLFGLVSCSSDDNIGIEAQAHDDNEMMAVMHAMMERMQTVSPTKDPDIDFARMMVMHHEGAIDMGNLELEKGNNQEMRTMAQDIITAQQQEIEQFQSILNGLVVDETDTGFPMEQMANMDKMGTVTDTQLISGNIDEDFVSLMMVHHQAAMDNASSYLHHGTNGSLRAMATKIIEMQTKEIIEMGNWLINNR